MADKQGDGTIGKAERWPDDIEFTEKYPGFYMDKLENGSDEDKERAIGKLLNQYSNNYLMNSLKQWENGRALTLMHDYYEGVVKKNEIFRLMSLGNLLIGLGHPEYADKEPKWMFNTRGNGENTPTPVEASA